MTTRADLSQIAEEAGSHTRLMRAAHQGDFKAVRALSPGIAEVNERDGKGHTALMFATVNRRAEIVKELLKLGADVNATANDGATALMLAASSGDIEIVRSLLEKGADVSLRYGSTEDSAITIARRSKHEDVVHLLEQHWRRTTLINESDEGEDGHIN